MLGDVPDTPSEHDVEELGLARIELHRARRLLDRLSPSHRSVLLAEVGAEKLEERNSAAIKMVRMRARKRLTALMNASNFGFVGFWLKDMARRTSDFSRRHMTFTEQAGATAMAAASLITAVAILGGPAQKSAHADEAVGPGRGQKTIGEMDLVSARRASRAAIAIAAERASGKKDPSGSRVAGDGTQGEAPYDVTVGGGGPAEGDASVGIVPDEDENWTPSAPECHHDADPEHGEASAGCYIDGPGDDVNVSTSVRIQP
ncbi:MAG: hypothetical protein ACRDLB_14305 [Actinomycetota bacterium]